MTRCMKVTIGVEINENEVREYIKRNGGDPEEVNDNNWWLEYAEIKYGQGLGTEASFC